jgi:hypothetical protein
MNLPIRSILALSILVIVLAACSTNSGSPASQPPSPTEPATPSVEPSVEPMAEPSESPADEERDVAGTITVAEGMAFSGPGGTIQEALDIGPTGDDPTLVNGVLFRDTDGTVYLATSVSDTDAPSFDGPMLEVLNTPNDGPSWDMENAELLGLQDANGIIFLEGAQILGYLELS